MYQQPTKPEAKPEPKSEPAESKSRRETRLITPTISDYFSVLRPKTALTKVPTRSAPSAPLTPSTLPTSSAPLTLPTSSTPPTPSEPPTPSTPPAPLTLPDLPSGLATLPRRKKPAGVKRLEVFYPDRQVSSFHTIPDGLNTEDMLCLLRSIIGGYTECVECDRMFTYIVDEDVGPKHFPKKRPINTLLLKRTNGKDRLFGVVVKIASKYLV